MDDEWQCAKGFLWMQDEGEELKEVKGYWGKVHEQ